MVIRMEQLRRQNAQGRNLRRILGFRKHPFRLRREKKKR